MAANHHPPTWCQTLATRPPKSDQFQKIDDVANSLDLTFAFLAAPDPERRGLTSAQSDLRRPFICFSQDISVRMPNGLDGTGCEWSRKKLSAPLSWSRHS